MFLTIITFIIVLSVIVFFHELGHFWTARKFGLTPEEFGFGFPPRANGWYKNRAGQWRTVRGSGKPADAADTIYSVNWLPLGGFVKLGEDETEVDSDKNHFHNKPAWQRAVILLAGVSMNMVLAVVLISFGFMVGLPQALDGLPDNARVSDRAVQILEVIPESPAAAAGIKMGDHILAIDGQAVERSETVSAFNQDNIGQPALYSIRRGGTEMEVTVVAELRPDTNAGGIGVAIIDTGLVRFSVPVALWEGIKTTVAWTFMILAAFVSLFKNLFSSGSLSADVAGPVGIAVITGQVARMGIIYIIQFAAMLSINLAIINALPFPALDGGRVIFLLVEKIKGSPVRKEVEGAIHYLGFALLMALILFVTFRDIDRYTGFFQAIGRLFS